MYKLFEALREKDVSRISLSVDPGNISAMKLYKRFGFEEVGMVGTSVTMVAEVHT
ncbi:GNAT family N-acetyltransferase [Paenibacillus sp. D2_2]|uniref:GNAT family N-acetyltransferase n=1 Tax=Paenibacillus sp. D2_2 TaxID=3073092 RepID=UPI002814B8D8|nr:GNAT family N-acetyltransferase [Paenibacillus sp. D2_2]WMT43010.1 GNAT family N-acetyltransferase [Paenibacillus sp. D2_2]